MYPNLLPAKERGLFGVNPGGLELGDTAGIATYMPVPGQGRLPRERRMEEVVPSSFATPGARTRGLGDRPMGCSHLLEGGAPRLESWGGGSA